MASVPSLIEKKREGKELAKKEIEDFVGSVTNGTIQDSQIGAMLMAIYLKGMTNAETVELTRAMAYSGQVFSYPDPWRDLLVDKHSTGGVGDKVSLILAPALAALGFKVPMISGRGLGHTGGTLDKLESIKGFKTKLTDQEMMTCLETAGCFIAGATNSLAPADAVLYQHRDVTSTVGCLPLVVSSILSKKVAEGTKALVMDVKVGRGAVFKDIKEAEELSKALIAISQGLGVETKVAITRMDHPLGRAVGNAVEVEEALQCLRGVGPADLTTLVNSLGALILVAKGKAETVSAGTILMEKVIANGYALLNFKEMLVGQGVENSVAHELCFGKPELVLPQPAYTTGLTATEEGTVQDIDALAVGLASWALGAGRAKASDTVDHSVGIKLKVQVGEKIKAGQVWVEILHASEKVPCEILKQVRSAIKIGDSESCGDESIVYRYL